jgi:hypothetical protein
VVSVVPVVPVVSVVTEVELFVVSVCEQAAKRISRKIVVFMSTPWRSIAR